MPPDVVYLGVLHTQHLRVGLLFLNAGKNVLCEKPFAMNSGEVKQLIDAAGKNNVFLMEVQTTGRLSCVSHRLWRYSAPFETPIKQI